MNKEQIDRNPEYVQGQILALQALISAISDSVPNFRRNALAHLNALRDAIIQLPVSELRLEAIEATTEWVRGMPEPPVAPQSI